MSRRTSLLGLSVDEMTRAEAVDTIRGVWRRGAKSRVFFVHAHCFNAAARSEAYRESLREAEFVLPGGSGVLLASKLLRLSIRHDLNGTDLTPMICKAAAEDGRSVYLLGGRPGVAERAAAMLRKRYPSLRVAGSRDGTFRPGQSAEVVADINAAEPDILLVALGVPTQELWISNHFGELETSICLASEALFDFVSNTATRAPRVMRTWRIEWVHWLYREPSRLWTRYLLGDVLFLARIVRARLGRWSGSAGPTSCARAIPASGMLPAAPQQTANLAPYAALPVPQRGNLRWSAAPPQPIEAQERRGGNSGGATWPTRNPHDERVSASIRR